MVGQKQPLFVEERKAQIITMLERREKVLVPELCEEFGVSQVTIRNDLRELQNEGKLRRTHGGAIAIRHASYEPVRQVKEVTNIEAKKRIAEKAASFVQDGDTIALDTGSTVMELVKLLHTKQDLSVVTNDMQIALFAEENLPQVRIVLAGGLVRMGQHCTTGPITLECLRGLNVDKAFIGANGFSGEHGITTPSHEHAVIKRKLMEISSENIVLADSSKSGKISFVEFANWDLVNCLVTDKMLSETCKTKIGKVADHVDLILV